MAETSVTVHGEGDPRFAGVGAACAVYHPRPSRRRHLGGSPIAIEASRGQRDTTALVFSTTKGMAATCVLRLVERGLLDVDAPIATCPSSPLAAAVSGVVPAMALPAP